ncbi:TPA: phage minor tail protein G [Salmonella enterica subsp. enterica serovar Hvittingfoss]|nr:phage minor tail protein G [Salmonella enterica subsp. enterica serovar Hvittingfoss]
MFLKKETFTYDDASVTLYELSGLQRVEYLEFIQKRTAKYDTDMANAAETDKRVAYMQMGVEINAWLVSRSLFNGDTTQDVDALCRSLQGEWSYEALGKGADTVLALSGLEVPAENGPDGGTVQAEDTPPEKS